MPEKLVFLNLFFGDKATLCTRATVTASVCVCVVYAPTMILNSWRLSQKKTMSTCSKKEIGEDLMRSGWTERRKEKLFVNPFVIKFNRVCLRSPSLREATQNNKNDTTILLWLRLYWTLPFNRSTWFLLRFKCNRINRLHLQFNSIHNNHSVMLYAAPRSERSECWHKCIGWWSGWAVLRAMNGMAQQRLLLLRFSE